MAEFSNNFCVKIKTFKRKLKTILTWTRTFQIHWRNQQFIVSDFCLIWMIMIYERDQILCECSKTFHYYLNKITLKQLETPGKVRQHLELL